MKRNPRAAPVYIALTGDLVGSKARRPQDRAQQQRHVLAMLAGLNSAFTPGALAAPLTLTAGDEIQGLFRGSDELVTTIQELTDRLFGVPTPMTGWRYFPYIVFGAGRGPLTTGSVPPAPEQAPNPALLDGPAFHHARAALQSAQKRRAWVSFRGFGDPADEILDALFSLMGAVRSRWGVEQSMNSYHARRVELYKDLAEKRGVSRSVINESLAAAHHKALLSGEEAARKLLATLDP